MDRDCPHSLVCTDKNCQNPCRSKNPCLGNQDCKVNFRRDGKKSVSCSCPPGFASSYNGFCESGTSDLIKIGKKKK